MDVGKGLKGIAWACFLGMLLGALFGGAFLAVFLISKGASHAIDSALWFLVLFGGVAVFALGFWQISLARATLAAALFGYIPSVIISIVLQGDFNTTVLGSIPPALVCMAIGACGYGFGRRLTKRYAV